MATALQTINKQIMDGRERVVLGSIVTTDGSGDLVLPLEQLNYLSFNGSINTTDRDGTWSWDPSTRTATIAAMAAGTHKFEAKGV